MTQALHFPIDFERREYVRLFKRLILQKNEGGHGVLGLTYLFRMWVDWATAGVEFRSIGLFRGTVDAVPWDEIELTFIIEDFCGWTGQTGELIKAAIRSGVMELTSRGEGADLVSGLILKDFWSFNPHFSKQYKTMQQKGAMAKAAKASAAELRAGATHNVSLIEGQGKQFALPLDANPTRDEIEKSVALIMMIDRACDKPLRQRSEYTENESLMLSALNVVRGVPQEDIQRVYQYIIVNRDNPRLGKIPERILEQFNRHLDESKLVTV